MQTIVWKSKSYSWSCKILGVSNIDMGILFWLDGAEKLPLSGFEKWPSESVRVCGGGYSRM